MKHHVTSLLLMSILTTPALSADIVKIGIITTLTTPASIIGRDVVDATNLAVQHVGGAIAGKRIELVIEDDGVKPDLGRQKAEKLLRQDNVDVVSGFIWSNVLLAARKPVLDSGKLLISTNAGPSDLAGKLCHPNFFSTRAQNDMLPMAVGHALNARNINKIYVMSPNYAAGRDMAEGVQRTFKGKAAGIDYTKWGDDPQLDFSAELAKAKASGADALYVFYPGRAGSAFARQFDQSGIASQMKLFTAYTLDQLALPTLQEAGVKGVLGTESADYWSPNIDTPANKRFVEDFRAKFNRLPSNYAAAAYDFIPYLKAAIEQSGGDPSNVVKIRDALRKADYESVRGHYEVGPNGFPIDRFYRQEIAADPSGVWTLQSKELVMEKTRDPHIDQCKLKS
jgi:branched-chain amino acid transport system substrate-binding protein